MIKKILIGLWFFLTTTVFSQHLAFPEAEGFGRFTTGGRLGKVISVTNLNDSGTGSLREAIKTHGKRIVLFKISGNIDLKSPLVIKHNDITIAGQTAPGDGICIRHYPLIVNADNVIIRYIRVRLGDMNQLEEDAISATGQRDIMIDHCSFSWGTDEVASFYNNENSTVQWCIISESLHHSFHHKGPHGYGGIWGGRGATFHHNLIAHHASRMPRLHGSRMRLASGEYIVMKENNELVDFKNNVIFNWGFNNCYGGEGGSFNIVANYYKAGPASEHKNRIAEPWGDLGKWYVADNFVHGCPETTENNWVDGIQGKFCSKVRIDHIHPTAPINIQTAEEAFESVLLNAGANLPKRDSVDSRIIHETRSGKTKFGGKYRPHAGIIDSQATVGGWPELVSSDAPKDQDSDGIPDDFEMMKGWDPLDPQDQNQDYDGNGYTNIEEYLNSFSVRSQ